MERLETGEITFLCVSSLILALVVWTGTSRWIGVVMVAGYVAFIVLEFTAWRR